MSERAAIGPRAAERWSPPRVEGAPPGRAREVRDSAAAAAQQAEAAAYSAGLARAQGEVQSRIALLNARVERFDLLLRQLEQPLRMLDAEVEQALLTLALSIGSQLARRALQSEPSQVIGLVRDCLKELPLGTRGVRVHLHPEDAAVVRERLAAQSGEGAWALVEDPTLTRGGCLIESEASRLDARFESRVQALLAAALGDPRGPSRTADEVRSSPGSSA
jgi:flagellar assembly protein FliH